MVSGVFLCVVVLSTLHNGAAVIQAGSQPPTHRDLVYGKVGDAKLKLDLYLPSSGKAPYPLIIWIHGGGWRAGSKDQCLPVRMGFVIRGYAVASIEYRLTGIATFPVQIEDCKAAVRWLRANAGKYGLDPDHFGAWGSSAGGHLAALLGTAGDVAEFEVGDNLHVSSRVQAVCDYFGPSDLTAMARERGFENHGRAESPEGLLLGGPVEERREQARKASPVTYVSRDDPPFLIVHGEKDRTVPPSQSKLLHDALTKAGVESTLKMLSDAAHGGPGFATPDMVALVSSFFDKHLKKSR